MNEADIHIIAVEDDLIMREAIIDMLSVQGYSIEGVDNVDSAISAAYVRPAQVFLIDINLPGSSGLTLVKRIRAESNAGIIIVTGQTDEIDRVVGLEIGADDYVCKPFNARELLARVNTVVRRTAQEYWPTTIHQQSANDLIYEFSGYALNTVTRQLTTSDQNSVELTSAEYHLLLAFLQAPLRVHTRESLYEKVFHRESPVLGRSIDGLVSKLRKKLTQEDSDQPLFKSIRGEGYTFSARVIKRVG